MGIKSYDTEKFVVGQEYWTFYMELSNRGISLRNYTGLMKVKLDRIDKSSYKPKGYKYFTILESKKLGSTIAHNIHHYMEGYGIASCDFFESKEEAIKAHDKALIEMAGGLSVSDRAAILSKRIVPTEIKKPKVEVDSIAWYKKLNKKEQGYVQWIKENYDFYDPDENKTSAQKDTSVVKI